VARARDSGSTEPDSARSTPEHDRLRRQQVIGILLVAAAILVFTLIRANWHDLFPQGWWRW
jgi:hypothetical protein